MAATYPRGRETDALGRDFAKYRFAESRSASSPPSGTLGAPDARPRRGTRQQTLVRDRVTAFLARPIAPAAQSNECAVDILEMRTRLIDECRELRALEPDGRALGVVLVVRSLERRRLDDPVELARELADPGRGLLTIDLQLVFERNEILWRAPRRHDL
jgi:hypothetical protein